MEKRKLKEVTLTYEDGTTETFKLTPDNVGFYRTGTNFNSVQEKVRLRWDERQIRWIGEVVEAKFKPEVVS